MPIAHRTVPLPCGHADGFILLEVLVTLVVFGCLLLALTQGARFSVAAWSAQARVAGAGEEFTTVSQGRCGYGTCLPLLVVFPFANTKHVDHALTDQTSILRFIEDN
jgi:hypothetical protein